MAMARCRGTTKKGTRCRNAALEGKEHCYVHAKQARAGGGELGESDRDGKAEGGRGVSSDRDELIRTVMGAALVGGVILWALVRRR